MVNSTTKDHYQFERKGYFAPDKDSTPEKLIFNRTVGLKESSVKVKLEGGATKSRKEEQAKQAAEKDRLRKIPPEMLFKQETEIVENMPVLKYSQFDETGMPTHDRSGEKLTKSALKKLAKELEKHKKLHEAYLKETSGQ